jgi:peroxiredoxin
MGAYDNDRQTGAWSYFTEAGEPHATGFYNSGIKDGAWTWWHPNGQVKVRGRFTNGMKVALWRTWDDQGQTISEISYTVDGKPMRVPPPPVVTIKAPPPALPPSETSLVAVEPPIIPVTVTEQPTTEVETVTDKVVSKPAESDAIVSTAVILSPTVSVPTLWTTIQESNAAKLIRKYTTGTLQTGGVYDDNSFGGTGDRQREDLLGKPMPQTRFLSSTGGALNLEDMCKKGPVLVVILRGFSGQVCLYCAAQTTAISEAIQRFEKNNIQVVIVYPGPVDAVPSFLKAVRSLANDPPQMPIALDVSLLAVRALGIEDNLAKPTAIMIDTKGIIRYAYVGKTIADRPSVDDLITVGHRLAPGIK